MRSIMDTHPMFPWKHVAVGCLWATAACMIGLLTFSIGVIVLLNWQP